MLVWGEDAGVKAHLLLQAWKGRVLSRGTGTGKRASSGLGSGEGERQQYGGRTGPSCHSPHLSGSLDLAIGPIVPLSGSRVSPPPPCPHHVCLWAEQNKLNLCIPPGPSLLVFAQKAGS